MIKPEEIPQFTGDLGELEKAHAGLKRDAGHIRGTGAEVHAGFQGLSAYYKAPDAEQLFATSKPVKDRADGFATGLETVSTALSDYATEIRPLAAKLERLKSDATAFVNGNKDDDGWQYDGDKVEEHNRLRADITATVAAFWAAERTCHNKITALWGGIQMAAGDGSGSKDQYGFSAEDLKGAKLPWGDPVEEKHHWYEVGHWVKSFVWDGLIVDGVWGTVKGLGTLVGFGGWEAMGQAWKGLAQLATGLAVTTIPGAGAAFWNLPDDRLPSWLRDSRTAMKETGKALVAWDEWGKNPGRAAGAVTFNVLTTVFTGGAGGAASGAGKAGAVARTLSLADKAGRVIDPMTYIGKGAGAGLSKTGDIAKNLRGVSSIDIPTLPKNAITLPEGALRLPDGTFRLPEGVPLPKGAAELPGGTVKFPDDVPVLPQGTTKLPTPPGTPDRFYDPTGNLLDENGKVIDNIGDAPAESSPQSPHPAPDTHTPSARATPEQPALAGAGVHTGGPGDTIRLRDSISDQAGDIGRAGDHPPDGHPGDHLPGGSGTDHLPRGHTGDNLPGGHPDDPSKSPSAHHEPPGGHGSDSRHGSGTPEHHEPVPHTHGYDGASVTDHADSPGDRGDGAVSGSDDAAGDTPNEDTRHEAPDGPSEGGMTGGPGGASWVTRPSDFAGRVYDQIRATPNREDLPRISQNTGINESVLRQVKTHLFRAQHEVTIGPNEVRRGLFEPADDIAELWPKAQQGILSEAEMLRFRSLMAHEYMESELMNSGLPYTQPHPHLWEVDPNDGGYYRNFPESVHDAGAHDLAPNERKGGFGHWRSMGLEEPEVVLRDDMSNIDDVVKAVARELRSKGLDLK